MRGSARTSARRHSNPTDWKHLAFNKPGYSSGSDFAGVVVKGAGDFKEGDRVAGFTRGGALQQDNGAFAGNIIIALAGFLTDY